MRTFRAACPAAIPGTCPCAPSCTPLVDDLDLFGGLHSFDGAYGKAADWRGINEAILCECLRPERLACTFSVPDKNCFVLCLRPSDSPFEPPPGRAFPLTKGVRRWGKAHWVCEPGLPMDAEALRALRSRDQEWSDVASAISLEYSYAHQKAGKDMPSPVDGMDEELDHGAPTGPSAATSEDHGSSLPKVMLTRQQAMDMQLELLSRFEDPMFQRELHVAWDAAEGDLLKQMEARMKVCLTVQADVIPKYGFEPSRQGVAQSVYSVRALFLEDWDMMNVSDRLCFLVDPPRQRQG
mmetsp:Transcript_72163/g.163817  ORF Transcript_72163/g.163817 Transcript_72163/m.163817 type:complete len:295 (-) Transcript_72163:21-905(-)